MLEPRDSYKIDEMDLFSTELRISNIPTFQPGTDFESDENFIIMSFSEIYLEKIFRHVFSVVFFREILKGNLGNSTNKLYF